MTASRRGSDMRNPNTATHPSVQTLLVQGFEVVIGFETHAQLSTRSKIFSRACTAFGAAPNTQACAVDLALPGTLPVMNRGAVERAIRFGLAIGADIAPRSVFARKNYFYPDLPKGYQISQFELPVVQGGHVFFMLDAMPRSVRLVRAHLEEDAGKSLHEGFVGQSGIDLNRAGTPLLEIVTEPDMRSSAEAVAYAKELHRLVTWIGICDGNMQEGSFRCDANVSVRRPGAELGTRREIKNLNSFKFMQQAIDYEVRWQIAQIEDGHAIEQATVLFNPDTGETRSMRSKEDAADYRYFPDPDLPPLVIDSAWIERVRTELPPSPSPRPWRNIFWMRSRPGGRPNCSATGSPASCRGGSTHRKPTPAAPESRRARSLRSSTGSPTRPFPTTPRNRFSMPYGTVRAWTSTP